MQLTHPWGKGVTPLGQELASEQRGVYMLQALEPALLPPLPQELRPHAPIRASSE